MSSIQALIVFVRFLVAGLLPGAPILGSDCSVLSRLADNQTENPYLSTGRINKALYAEVKPQIPREVRGGHSYAIVENARLPDGDPQKQYALVGEPIVNPDGTLLIKFKKHLGSNKGWSKTKTSTLMPKNWTEEDFEIATLEICKLEQDSQGIVRRPSAENPKEEEQVTSRVGDVFHKGKRLRWQVIKRRSDGKVVSSFPLGDAEPVSLINYSNTIDAQKEGILVPRVDPNTPLAEQIILANGYVQVRSADGKIDIRPPPRWSKEKIKEVIDEIKQTSSGDLVGERWLRSLKKDGVVWVILSDLSGQIIQAGPWPHLDAREAERMFYPSDSDL